MVAVVCVMLLALLAGGCSDGSTNPTPSPTAFTPPPPRQIAPAGPFFGAGTRILPGQTVVGTVESNDPACFPSWDSGAACKSYLVTAPRDGRLKALLKWTPAPTEDLMDLFLVSPSGFWVVSPEAKGEEVADLPVTGGLVYTILVMSYSRSPIQFELVPTFE